jgi:hypothetical protein
MLTLYFFAPLMPSRQSSGLRLYFTIFPSRLSGLNPFQGSHILNLSKTLNDNQVRVFNIMNSFQELKDTHSHQLLYQYTQEHKE